MQGLPYDVKYTSVFFIEGLYSKGPGNSFALPTHEPILIIRDPPGGSSYAKFENVVTKIRAVSDTMQVTGGGEAKLGLGFGADVDVDACVGGGFGAIVLGCSKVVDTEVDATITPGIALQTDFVNEESEASSTYSVTWSYETNSEPTRAGPESDIFVGKFMMEDSIIL